MNRHVVLGTAVAGLILLATSAWTQDPETVRVKVKGEPPTYRDVLQGHVGEKCFVREIAPLYYLDFSVNEKRASVTLTAAGSNFVQLLWPDGVHRYVPLERIELWVKP